MSPLPVGDVGLRFWWNLRICRKRPTEGPGALTAWPETLGSTRRICGGGFRCLGSGRSVSGNTWCLILTFIRPHTPKPWCQEKADDSPEGRGGRVLGLAAGRGAEGQTHVAEPRENRAPAKRVARTRELRGRHSSDSRSEPASRPRSRPCCLQRDRRHGSSGRVLRSAWDRSPAGCHSQFYAEPLSSDERRSLTRSSKPPWAEINRFGRGPPCPGEGERRGAGLAPGNSLGECGARSFRHLGSFSASNKVTLEITPNFF